MKLPVVAIVGRPNVGKSSLLNCLARKRVSIVDETPGVTRDRVSDIMTHGDVTFEIVDTGGIGIVDRDDLGDHVERQIARAVHDANAILLVTDVRDGVTPLDREVVRRLRARSREIPVFLVVNKVDSPKLRDGIHEFHSLGMGDPIPVSAKEIYGTRDLLDRVVEKLWPTGDAETEPVMKLAVVGRQNVGKSTFVNAIAREERVIVSEVPGTTRDSVDVHFEKDGKRFVVIDTAGVRQKSRLKDAVEHYSQVRTEAAIRRADVVLFLIDASEEVTRLEKRLGEFIESEGRIAIIVVNKWDLALGKAATETYADYLYDRLRGLRHAPIAFTTATGGRNVLRTIDLAQSLFRKALRRVGTGELNRVLEAVKDQNPPRAKGSKLPKIFYATQVGTVPPTFVIFVNDARLFPESYRRYVEHAFREALGLDELPIVLHFRGKVETSQDRGSRSGARPRSREKRKGSASRSSRVQETPVGRKRRER